MKKEIVNKKFVLPGDFEASIRVGDRVRPGMEIGVGRIPDVVAKYEIGAARVLVDEGTFIVANSPILEYRNGFKREIVNSSVEGIVRIREGFVELVSDEKEEIIKASLWGRLLSIGEQDYSIEAQHIVLPLFVGYGDNIDSNLHLIFNNGGLIAPQHISSAVKDKVAVLLGPLTYETYQELVKYEAAGVLAPSIDWNHYLKIFKSPPISVGIIHGFGMFPLWTWYHTLLSKMQDVSVEVNFSESFMRVPVSDILLGSLPKDMLIFKEFWWGKQIKELTFESGEYLAVLETGEKTPVLAEELFNIR